MILSNSLTEEDRPIKAARAPFNNQKTKEDDMKFNLGQPNINVFLTLE